MAITVVLGNGELGYDPSNKIAKIGNGSTQWDSLDPFNTTEIVDNLTSTSTTSALSANQGKVLKDSIDLNTSTINENINDINNIKLNITSLQNKTSDLNVNDITTMKSDINNRIRYDEVINNLTSTSTSAPLSANQGKVLNERVSYIERYGTKSYDERVGDLDDLTTEDKSSIVAAINEIIEEGSKGKRDPEFTIDKTSVNLIGTETTDLITTTFVSDGIITAISSNTGAVTTNVNGKVVTLTCGDITSNTSAKITIILSETNAYYGGTVTIAVTCNKREPNLTLDKTAVTIYSAKTGNVIDTVTATYSGSGAITASSNNDIITTDISDNNVTLTCMPVTSETTATVTITLAATNEYYSETATVTVTCKPPKTLEDSTWEEIQTIGAVGTGANYFDIGDTKTITLNGTVGTLALDNFRCKVFIIDFNYHDDNGIYFQGFKTTDGADVALCDSNYGSIKYDGTKCFNINHWGSNSGNYNTNFGGWKGCDLRYDILGSTETAPSDYGKTHTTSCIGYDATSAAKTSPIANTLMAALPVALRNVLAAWTIYTDNTGNKSNTAANVTASIDYLPLLSEYEVHGERKYANEYEQSKQAQMAYYANGNSKVKYNHNNTGSAVFWWGRSPSAGNTSNFCSVSTDGSANGGTSHYSDGVAPAFKIA